MLFANETGGGCRLILSKRTRGQYNVVSPIGSDIENGSLLKFLKLVVADRRKSGKGYRQNHENN